MSFIIRRISHTEDGREIVRATTLDKPTLSIGRAAENDIALPDLRVSPVQAKITQLDGRRVTVNAVDTLGFELDGRTTQRANIDAHRGAELRFGNHRITVALDAKRAILLTVERAESDADSDREHDEALTFSLRSKLPGKRASAWTLAIAILLAFLAWPIASFYARAQADHRSIYAMTANHSWSSGPLSTAHHGLENNCEACHQQAFVSVRDDSCRACHKDAHDHAPADRIVHARAKPGIGGQFLWAVAKTFNKPGPGACVDCHTEHEGAGPMQPTAQAFCTDCHATLKLRLPDTKLANAGDFGTAHPQFMPLIATAPGEQPLLKRVSLDAPALENNGLKFPHKLHLDPLGGVARMAQTLGTARGYGQALDCKDCHTPSADGTRFQPITMERNCQACHSLAFDRIGGTVRTLRHGDPKQMMADLRALFRSTPPDRPLELGGMAQHRPGDYAARMVTSTYAAAAATRPGSGDAAVRAVFSPGGACYDCHTVTPPGVNGATDWTVTPVHQPMRYMLHGWFDHAAHKTEKCASCHAAAQSTKASDLILPGIKTCRNCHAGEGAIKAKVPSSCGLCHSYHGATDAPWRPSRGYSPAIAARMSPWKSE